MALHPNGLLRPSNHILSSSRAPRLEDYDGSSSDSGETARAGTRSRAPFVSSTTLSNTPMSNFLLLPTGNSTRSSSPCSTASSTPVPSRSTSPLPEFYPSNPSSSCTSDSEDDNVTPLMLNNRNRWVREEQPRWWSIMTKRRRRRGGRVVKFAKKWTRRIVRHPFFPRQPITIVSDYAL
jgi:hypothetical protein